MGRLDGGMLMYESGNTFVVSWNNLGLECIIPVTEMEKEQTWSALKADYALANPNKGGRLNTVTRIVGQLMLRARFNPQRHYEIYAVDAVDGITSDDLRHMFESDPQAAADLIRDRGRMLYSDRADQRRIKIL